MCVCVCVRVRVCLCVMFADDILMGSVCLVCNPMVSADIDIL